MTGSQSTVVNMPLPEDDPQRRRPDIAKAQQLLDWSPRTSLTDGLRTTVDWFAAALQAEPEPVRSAKGEARATAG